MTRQCTQCERTESPYWTGVRKKLLVCWTCYMRLRYVKASERKRVYQFEGEA